MQPFREKSTPISPSSLPFILGTHPPLALALATLPCLGILILGRTLTYGLTQFGMASEEIFRSIQLPILNTDPQERS